MSVICSRHVSRGLSSRSSSESNAGLSSALEPLVAPDSMPSKCEVGEARAAFRSRVDRRGGGVFAAENAARDVARRRPPSASPSATVADPKRSPSEEELRSRSRRLRCVAGEACSRAREPFVLLSPPRRAAPRTAPRRDKRLSSPGTRRRARASRARGAARDRSVRAVPCGSMSGSISVRANARGKSPIGFLPKKPKRPQ